MIWIFYILAAVAIVASVRVITNVSPVHALLSLIVSLLAVAGIFFLLGAPFAGALEIIVYAGAILVLFVFVVMMLNLGKSADQRESDWLSAQVWAIPTALGVILIVVMSYLIAAQPVIDGAIGREVVSIKSVGIALYTEYVILVEVAAFLLLAALIAAYHLGKRSLEDDNLDAMSHDINGHASVSDAASNNESPL